MKKEILKVAATVEQVKTLADGGLRLYVDTQELLSEDKGKVMAMHKQMGVFVFSPQDIQEDDLKDLPQVKLEEGEKQPSARLRGVLYVYWDQHKVGMPFELFYRKEVERFIDSVKAKLTPL